MCQNTKSHTTEGESDNKKSGKETAQDPNSPNQETEQETRQDSSLTSQLEERLPEWIHRYSADDILVEEVGLAVVTFSALLANTVLSVTLPLTWKSLRYGQVFLLVVGLVGVMVGVWVKIKARKSKEGDEEGDAGER